MKSSTTVLSTTVRITKQSTIPVQWYIPIVFTSRWWCRQKVLRHSCREVAGNSASRRLSCSNGVKEDVLLRHWLWSMCVVSCRIAFVCSICDYIGIYRMHKPSFTRPKSAHWQRCQRPSLGRLVRPADLWQRAIYGRFPEISMADTNEGLPWMSFLHCQLLPSSRPYLLQRVQWHLVAVRLQMHRMPISCKYWFWCVSFAYLKIQNSNDDTTLGTFRVHVFHRMIYCRTT